MTKHQITLFSFFKKYYLTEPRSEEGLNGGTTSKTYSYALLTKEEIMNVSTAYCKTIDAHVNGNKKILPIMYLLLNFLGSIKDSLVRDLSFLLKLQHKAPLILLQNFLQ